MEHRRRGSRRCAGSRPSEVLIPALPNELVLLCLLKIPPRLRLPLRCVSKAWRSALGKFPKHRRLLVSVSDGWYDQVEDLTWHVFDPLPCRWQQIPAPSPLPPVHGHVNLPYVLRWNTFRGSHGTEVISMFGPHTFYLEMKESSSSKCRTKTRYSWRPTQRMIEEDRWIYAAAGSEDGQFVYVAGGGMYCLDGRQCDLKSAERFNVKRQCWENLLPLHQPRRWAVPRMLGDGRFCISAGEDNIYSEVYDPTTSQWSFVRCPLSKERQQRILFKGQRYFIKFNNRVAMLMCEGNAKSLGIVPIPATFHPWRIKLCSMGDNILVFSQHSLLITSPVDLPLHWTCHSLPFQSSRIRSHIVFGEDYS